MRPVVVAVAITGSVSRKKSGWGERNVAQNNA
jgi:hypothetical protein